MITAATFEMVEGLTREKIEQHPVWRPYDEAEDRESILAWGVSAEALDQQIERFEFCGTQPLYPVLALDPLPQVAHLIVAAKFHTASGTALTGYVFRPHAFGVFVGDREFSFNRNLLAASARSAGSLGEALEQDPEALFPMRYASDLESGDGEAVVGEIERCW